MLCVVDVHNLEPRRAVASCACACKASRSLSYMPTTWGHHFTGMALFYSRNGYLRGMHGGF